MFDKDNYVKWSDAPITVGDTFEDLHGQITYVAMHRERSKGAVRNNVIEWSQDPNVIPALLAPAAPKVGVLEIKAKQLPELTLPRPSRSEVANGAANADWFPQYKRIANMPELPTPPPYRVLQPKAFMSLVCRRQRSAYWALPVIMRILCLRRDMGDPVDGPRALRQKEQRAIKKKKANKMKVREMDSSNSKSNSTNNRSTSNNDKNREDSVDNVKQMSILTDVLQQVIISKGGCFQMEAPRVNHPHALRQKDKRAIKKKKKAKMDSSIKKLRVEVDRLEKTVLAERAVHRDEIPHVHEVH
ncbi:LOW QUALITY PROTEIN: acid phosphatase [Aspergillus lentulus]|nr:LOW QUALITY PROTEIN: acid phosphatase [Aspergillus lentulus]